MNDIAALETDTTKTRDPDVPLTGKWLNSLCGCDNNCCPGGLAFFTICPSLFTFSLWSDIAMLSCVPCLIGQIAARTSWRPNFVGIHILPQQSCCETNCRQAWLVPFLLTLLPIIISAGLFFIPIGYALTAISVSSGWMALLHLLVGVPIVAGTCNSISLIVAIVFWGLTLALLTNMRIWIRRRYSIPGDPCTDCLVMTFCFPCGIAQMYAHVFAQKMDFDIISDPGPHPELNSPEKPKNPKKWSESSHDLQDILEKSDHATTKEKQELVNSL